jgi:hypothetical protein
MLKRLLGMAMSSIKTTPACSNRNTPLRKAVPTQKLFGHPILQDTLTLLTDECNSSGVTRTAQYSHNMQDLGQISYQI